MAQSHASETLLKDEPHEGGLTGAAIEESQSAEHSAIHISLKAEPVFHIGGFPVTNSLLLAVIVLGLLSALAISARKKIKLIPGMFQGIFEFFIENLLELMDTVFGERAKSERYLPIIATIFLFVLFSNWFGLLPLVGSVVVRGPHEAGRNRTAGVRGRCEASCPRLFEEVTALVPSSLRRRGSVSSSAAIFYPD